MLMIRNHIQWIPKIQTLIEIIIQNKICLKLYRQKSKIGGPPSGGKVSWSQCQMAWAKAGDLIWKINLTAKEPGYGSSRWALA
jgi:hypothetical protein